jgi:Flp pilus assembly protein TadG
MRSMPLRRHGSAGPRSRGQSVVEFALILPILLFLTLGVVDTARVFSGYISLTNGVSNAASYASQGDYDNWCASGGVIACPSGTTSAQMNADPDNIAYQVQVESAGLSASGISLSTPVCTLAANPSQTEACTSTTAGYYSQVTITASYDFTLLTPMMTALMGGPIHMSATTTAVMIPAQAPTLPNVAGIMFTSITQSKGSNDCAGKTISASIVCKTGGLGNTGGYFSAKVQLVDSSGNAVTNTTGVAIIVTASEFTVSSPGATVSPSSLTIANGASATSGTFTLAGLNPPDGWKANMICQVTLVSGSYTITIVGTH